MQGICDISKAFNEIISKIYNLKTRLDNFPTANNNLRNIKYVIGEDKDNKVSLLMDWAGIKKEVSDPWYTGDFETTYQDILKGCKGILNHLDKKY